MGNKEEHNVKSACDFHSMLEVKALGEDIFESQSHRENFLETLYGGQVLAQALSAANMTVTDRQVHSLHGYFLRSGKTNEPVIYKVERLRDGGSFSNRRIVAQQADRDIFHMMASFHKAEKGLHHQVDLEEIISLPEVDQGSSVSLGEIPEHSARDTASSPFKIIAVPENVYLSRERHKPDAFFWLKTVAPLPKGKQLQAAALAFASDLGLLASTILPHPTSLFHGDILPASIDHAMWFHSHDFDLSDWVLCHTHSPWTGNARGFAKASIYDKNFRLIASTAQEGLIRHLG